MNKWKQLRRQSLGAVPQQASVNLTAPEIAPSRKTNKLNLRTKPLNFKVSEEFYWKLKELALKEKKLMVEIIEKALAEYKEKSPVAKKSKIHKKTAEPKPTTQLIPYFPISFDCDNCGDKYEQDTAYSYAPNLSQLKLRRYPTYCSECVS